MFTRFFSLLAVLMLSIVTPQLLAQHRVSGRVSDAVSGEALQFANIWVEQIQSGTTTDKAGRFVLPLAPGQHVLVVSYIGYKSRRQRVSIPGDTEINITLQPSAIELPEVTITPGDNPALRIIRKAIEMKEVQKAKLRNYSLTSHSKLLIRVSGFALGGASASGEGESTTVTIGGNTDTADPDSTDSADSSATIKRDPRLPVILETQTDAYWAAPNRYKEVVTARKQSAFIPAQGNILVSAFFIIDFSKDELNLSDKAPVIGPISEAGLRHYYYRLAGTTFIDSTKIYQIEISPLSDSDPLLRGTIYIADESYMLSMVDVQLNDAALPTLLDTMAFRQNFRFVDGEFWMPADVIVMASAQIPVVNIGLQVEGFSVLQDYRINQEINEAFFDRTRIKVLKEADERDSLYWVETRKIPTSDEEERAYLVSDSIKIALDSTKYAVTFGSILSGGVTGAENVEFRYPGLVSLYQFNRIEGHALSGEFGFSFNSFPLRGIRAGAGYGFSDERLKYNLGASFRVFSSPALTFGASRYYALDYIDSEGDPNTAGLMTMLSWFGKYDYRDFFYRDGWASWLRYDPFLLFPMRITISRDGYYNAMKNSEWSLFNRDRSYRDNPPVNEGRITSVSGRMSLDMRDMLDNAGELSRIGRRNHIPTVGVGFHRIEMHSGDWDVTALYAGLNGAFDLGVYGVLSYNLAADRANAALPTQLLYNLRGGIQYLAATTGFRTLGFREFGGDTRAVGSFSYDFRDWLFRWLRVPLLRDSGFGLELFATGGWTTMRAETAVLQTVTPAEAKLPFWEAGFGIDNILSIFRVDMAWRLNHAREGRNFFIGLGGGILF
ncbi:MAG: DUF5686 and carboxypeptidase regulatory-like domain-containing protein [Bacteroidia bacterium]|nr:DUF5686 and carboxypeptidase regulatory-like domain-containing protein [Bacteroidia bacterium]